MNERPKNPVEQPAAAPSAVAYAQLTPSGKVAFFDGKPMLSTVQNEFFPVALGVILQPAPAPADKLAAFEAHLIDTYGVVQDDDPTTERVKRDWTAGWQAARAASANETGVEGATESQLALIMDRDAWRAAMQKLCTAWCTTPDAAADHLRARLKSRSPAMAAEPTACKGKNCGSLDPRFHSAECFEEYEKTVGLKPAQAGARVGLTDEQILEIGYKHFKPGHNVKAEANFVAAVRDILGDDRA